MKIIAQIGARLALQATVVGALLLTSATRLGAADPPLVVVVPATSAMQDISRASLRRAFLGEPTSAGGVRLIPLNQPPGTAARVQFDKTVLDLDPEAMSRFWIDQRIRGQPGSPRAIPVAMLTRVLPQLGGALGYVRLNEVGPGIKVITIDGKKAGDAGYLLP